MIIGRSHAAVMLVILVGALPLLVTACGEPEPTLTPSPTATVAATPTPTASPSVAAGQALYLAKGCAACHGQDAEGSAFAPAMAGYTEERVKLQVRDPQGVMPAFSEAQVTNEELDLIIAYITSLQGEGDESPEVLGQHLFERLGGGPACAYCHGFQAQGGFGPRLLGHSENTIRSIVRSGLEDMPTFSQEALSDEELDAIIAYIQSLTASAEATSTPEASR